MIYHLVVLSASCKIIIQSKAFCYLTRKWPSQCPDLNPIESLRRILKLKAIERKSKNLAAVRGSLPRAMLFDWPYDISSLWIEFCLNHQNAEFGSYNVNLKFKFWPYVPTLAH